jgi:hypothetical protein
VVWRGLVQEGGVAGARVGGVLGECAGLAGARAGGGGVGLARS